MAYVTKCHGSLLINGCSIKPGTSNYPKYPCNFVNPWHRQQSALAAFQYPVMQTFVYVS